MRRFKRPKLQHPWAKSAAGFTLIELIVVIAIIAILACLGTVGYSGYVKSANKKSDMFLVGNIMRGIEICTNATTFVDNDTSALAATVYPVGAIVLSNTEDCKVYASVLDTGWSAVPNESGVYYRQVSSSTSDQEFSVLAENKVTVSSTITKKQIDSLAGVHPTLQFTAYAIQSEHLEYTDVTDDNAKAAFAWSLVDNNPSTSPDGSDND